MNLRRKYYEKLDNEDIPFEEFEEEWIKTFNSAYVQDELETDEDRAAFTFDAVKRYFESRGLSVETEETDTEEVESKLLGEAEEQEIDVPFNLLMNIAGDGSKARICVILLLRESEWVSKDFIARYSRLADSTLRVDLLRLEKEKQISLSRDGDGHVTSARITSV